MDFCSLRFRSVIFDFETISQSAKMPTVPGCRSGYASSDATESHITFHKFPKDQKRCEMWIRRIHRDMVSSESHRVCSLHFHESAFKMISSDNNTRRHRSSSALRRRYLKPNVYPSFF